MSVRYARRVAETELCAVPGDFIDSRRFTRSPERYDLHPLERRLILRAWVKGAA